MMLLQAWIICLSLLSLADGLRLGRPVFGGCPGNYTTLNRQTCVLFVFDVGNRTSFNAARTACQADGGDLLRLNTAYFNQIRQLADIRDPACDFWVGAKEGNTDGVWYYLNGDPLMATSFFNPMSNSVEGGAHDCGKLSETDGFYLRDGGNCTDDSNGYICQTNPVILA